MSGTVTAPGTVTVHSDYCGATARLYFAEVSRFSWIAAIARVDTFEPDSIDVQITNTLNPFLMREERIVA